MPTVFRIGPYRFFFFAGDGNEPSHVHISRDANVAKVWLNPVHLASSGGFRSSEIRRILGIARMHEEQLMRSWNEFFGE